MDLTFRIDMQNTSVRNVADFLQGLTLINDGLILLGVDERAVLPYELPLPYFSSRILERLGDAVLLGQPVAFQELLTQYPVLILSTRFEINPERDIRISHIKKGSLEGVISDILDTIIEMFTTVLASVKDNAVEQTDAVTDTMMEDLRRLVPEQTGQRQKAAAIGAVGAGMQLMKRSMQSEGVTEAKFDFENPGQLPSPALAFG